MLQLHLHNYAKIFTVSAVRQTLVTLSLLSVILISKILLLILVSLLYFVEGDNSLKSGSSYNIELNANGTIPSTTTHTYLEIYIQAINPLINQVKLHAKFYISRPKVPLTIYLALFTPIRTDQSSRYLETDLELLLDGKLNHYPFDYYNISIPIIILSSDEIFSDYGAIAYATPQNWRFDTTFTTSNASVNLQFLCSRSPAIIGFCIFQTILMWAVTVSVVLITRHIWLYNHQVVTL